MKLRTFGLYVKKRFYWSELDQNEVSRTRFGVDVRCHMQSKFIDSLVELQTRISQNWLNFSSRMKKKYIKRD
jgi:hypothetical protein